jgi:hypothetical protein
MPPRRLPPNVKSWGLEAVCHQGLLGLLLCVRGWVPACWAVKLLPSMASRYYDFALALPSANCPDNLHTRASC